jgi:gliding motility-associated-like protein
MQQQLTTIIIFLLFGLATTQAQTLSFTIAEGTEERCAIDSFITINIVPNPGRTLTELRISWGDGTPLQTLNPGDPLTQSHRYPGPVGLSGCTYTQQCVDLGFNGFCFTLSVVALYSNGSDNNNGPGQENSAKTLTFQKPPLSVINPNSSIICVGGTITFNQATCPSNDASMTYAWQFHDGSTADTPNASYTYADAGTYPVTLTSTNNCGEHAATQQIEVLLPPIADPRITVGLQQTLGDTLVVCRGDTLQLDGQSFSLNENQWRWRFLSGTSNNCFSFVPLGSQGQSMLPNPMLVMLCEGVHRLELRVNNPCDEPDTRVLIIRVVGPLSGALTLNATDCTPTITLNPAESLTLTGQRTGCRWDFGNGQTSDLCDPGPITFSASSAVTFTAFNQCDTLSLSGQVTLTTSGQATILSPCPDTLCTFDPPCLLSADLAGGNWTVNGMAGGPEFDPATAALGLNTIVYGAPPCIEPDEVQIFVIDGSLAIAGPAELCIDGGTVAYTASAAGGVFSSARNAIDPLTGVYDPLLAGAGPDTIFYQTAGESFCAASASLPVEVVELGVGFELSDCDGLTLCFATTAASSAYSSISWDFGDGQSSAQAAPCHTYGQADAYTVTVSISAGACQVSATAPVAIEAPANANFALDYASPACGPLPIAIADQSTGDNLVYEWDIAGQLINTADPGPVVLNNSGTISLTVRNGCSSSTYSEDVVVAPGAQAGFGLNAFVCSGETLQIFDVATQYDQISWDFGNGQTSNQPGTQQVVYFTSGDNDTIFVTQIATNECGPDTLVRQVVVVPTDAQANVTVSAAPLFQVCQNEEVCFESFSLPSGVPLLWDFGDGNTAVGFNICHTWAAPGTYEVVGKLVSCGFDSTVVSITVLPIPTAAFEPPATGCPGETVTLSTLSSGAIGHEWDFGDGNFSTLVSPQHAYAAPGTYQACLTVTSANGCRETVCRSVVIAAPPEPDFTTANPGCEGDLVAFANASSPDVAICAWNFGDGNSSGSCSPQHAFSAAGTYNVRLTVTNADGCVATIARNVLVGARPLPAFEVQLPEDCHPATATFTNTSQLSDGYTWAFGDGQSSTQASPQHNYAQPGNYTVVLTAVRDSVCTATASANLTIHETPQAAIAGLPPSACAGEPLTFGQASSGPISRQAWDFGDGTFSFEASPVHQYSAAGNYTAVLTVYNGELCESADTVQLRVHPPVRGSAAITEVRCHGAATGAIALSVLSGTPPFQFAWSNGATAQSLSNVPAGTYSLQITDVNACRWDTAFVIGQPGPLSLVVTEEQVVTCAGGSDGRLCVSAAGGTPPYAFAWPDGTLGPCIADAPAGSYAPTVTDDSGCTHTEEVALRENPPITFTDLVQNRPCFGEDAAFLQIDGVQGGTPGYSIALEGEEGYFQTGSFFGQLRPGRYTLFISDAQGCMAEQAYTITEPDSIWLDILQDTFFIELGERVRLRIRHNLALPAFEWSPPDDLDCTDCPEPEAAPLRDRLYRLRATDANGCSVEDSVVVKTEIVRGPIYIPNTFTPNGDGRNDVFRIRSSIASIARVRAFRVLDRWGEVVFEAQDFHPADERPQDAWDGSFRGRLLAPDNYVYYAEIEYVDDLILIEKGNILLIR